MIPSLEGQFGQIKTSYLLCENHFSLIRFLFLCLHAWDNYLVYNLLSVYISSSSQIWCKWVQTQKLIITVSVKIMHIYNVCFNHKCPCSIMRCCAKCTHYVTGYKKSLKWHKQGFIQQCTKKSSSVATQNRLSLFSSNAKLLFTSK